jgi:hypothetical protein
MIVIDACTKMCLAFDIALASVVSYSCKCRWNLERHLLMIVYDRKTFIVQATDWSQSLLWILSHFTLT